MLGKSLFGGYGESSSGGQPGTRGEVSLVDGNLTYSADPDVLIEDGKVYFADSGLNAGMHLVDGKLYAEEVMIT